MAEKLDYVEARANVKSKVGYLTVALEGNFTAAAGQGAVGGATGQGGAGGTVNPRAERLRRILDAAKSRTPTQRDADKRLFVAQLLDGVLRADFERHGWTSPLSSARIAAFWEEMSPGLLAGVGGQATDP